MRLPPALPLPEGGAREKVSGFPRLRAKLQRHPPETYLWLHADDALQYFSMLLCFLADKPHLIKNIILTQANTYGICAVAMYFEGLRRHVFIDDYILCY
jgi:hypothetical protein